MSSLRRGRTIIAVAVLAFVAGSLAATAASGRTKPPPPAIFSVYQSNSATAQTTTAGSQILITLDATSFDPGHDFDTAASSYHAPSAGRYHFDARVGVVPTGGHRVFASVFVNNVEVIRGNDIGTTSSPSSSDASGTVQLAKGDVVTLRFFDNTDGDSIDKGQPYITVLSGFKVKQTP